MGSKSGLGLGFKLLIAAIVVGAATQFLPFGMESSRAEGDESQLDTPIALPEPTPADSSDLDPEATAALAALDDPEGFRITNPLTLADDTPLAHGEFIWEDAGVPDGELRIVVDLESEMLYAYRGGYEIGRSVILYGTDDSPTPTGVFTITEKDADHISNLYFVPMPYMLRLTNDGIAIHGNQVEYGYGSRGCVGVPVEFAELLFNEAELGDRVRIEWGSPVDSRGFVSMADRSEAQSQS